MDNANATPQEPGFQDQFEQLTKEQEKTEQLRRAERLGALGSQLSSLATECVSDRKWKEEQWLMDLRQYQGVYDQDVEAKLKNAKRSRLFRNATRPRTNMVASRIGDMLFPTDDRNYSVEPTPNPDLSTRSLSEEPVFDERGQPIVSADGQPVTEGQAAQALMDDAKKAAESMQTEIDDQLNEADYAVKARQAIKQACKLGTGVLRGPIVVGRTRRAYVLEKPVDPVTGEQKAERWVLKVVKDTRPSVEWIDLWNFFPDMAALRIDDCEFAFERSFLTKRQLQDLLDHAEELHYFAPMLEQLLREEPKGTRIAADHINQIREITGSSATTDDNRYEIWHYEGAIKREMLEACGIPLDGLEGEVFSGCVEFCGTRVIKAYINPLDSGDLPYSLFVLEEDDTSIFGLGVPAMIRDPQRAANAAWRMLFDNGARSAGAQIVVKKKGLTPGDGNWELGNQTKLWVVEGDDVDVNKVFGQFQIQNNQQQLSAILNDALQDCDNAINLPLIAQGQQDTRMTRTAQGMALLMNAANTVLRQSAKNWDDGITRPLVTRFYHWNMQYNEKPGIKGDFEVDARGTSVLLAREIQAQNLFLLATNFAAHPIFGQMIKGPALLRKLVQAHHISPDDIVRSDDEIQQIAQQQAESGQQDPRAALAQLQHQHEMEQLAYERETQVMREGLQRENLLIKLAADENMSLEQLKAELAKVQMKIEGDMALQTQEARIKMTMGSGL